MELAETPDLQEKLADSVAAGQWARNYMENEVVKREPLGTVFPLGLYLDKVQYKKRDSTLGIWAINCFTHRRHLMACIPTSQTCQCGRNGWCSLCPVLAFVEWSFCCRSGWTLPFARARRTMASGLGQLVLGRTAPWVSSGGSHHQRGLV